MKEEGGQKNQFKVGDLVQFDFYHTIGIVTEIKLAKEFDPLDNVTDVKILWSDGEEFWCLDFTLEPIQSGSY